MTYYTRDPVEFSVFSLPRYDGPGADTTHTYDPDCCSLAVCPQRDYNRTAMLTLNRLAQSYAALRLLMFATAQLWTCDDAGHTQDCPNPTCVFARDLGAALETSRLRLAGTVKELAKVLTTVAADLTPQWQDFCDADQAGVALDHLARQAAEGTLDARLAERSLPKFLDVWRFIATGDDDLEYARWFRPPAGDGPRS